MEASPFTGLFDDLGLTTAVIALWASRIVGLIILWFVVWVLVRYLSRWITLIDGQIEQLEIGRRDLKTIDRLLDYTLILIGIIISLAILGWTSLLYSALTAAGLFSVMIGFAVKDVAANFVAGIFLLIDQPFRLGDYIQVRDISGTVTDITLRATTVTTLDGPVIRIPNSILTVEPTTNYSTAEKRRIFFTISIAKDADIRRAISIVEKTLSKEEGLLSDPAPSVLVDTVREYAIDIQVIAYAPAATFIALASDSKRQVTNALQASDVELAMPIRKNINVVLPAEQASLEHQGN
jgi:small conductance mechanosensitive channel